MTFDELKHKDGEYIIGCYARNDAAIVSGKGAACVTAGGRRCIDFTSGIGVNALGFCDEEWAEAVKSQIVKLQHVSNLFYTEPCADLAEALAGRTGFKKAFFCNSGAEANECAIKAARKYSFMKYGAGRHEILTLENSFHGRTMAAVSATGQEGLHRFFGPFLDGFRHVPAGDAARLREAVTDRVCAVMLEVVQGEGGVVTLPEDYVREAASLCAEKDVLLIADEVQSGIGRTGRFMAYEHFGVMPDIATVAKGLGGGLPIGAALFGGKCEAVFAPGDHGSTFGGNPAVCAGGLAVLKRIDEAFLRDVREKSAYIVERLLKMPRVTGVSGLGLMLGVSVDGPPAKDVVAACLENGLLLLTAKEKLRLLPPLNISREEIDEGLAALEKALAPAPSPL